MSDEALILRLERKPILRVEIARSYAHKVNCANYGGPQFESRDFFASRKAECAIEDEAEVSHLLYESCKAEVLKAAGEYIQELRRRIATRKTA